MAAFYSPPDLLVNVKYILFLCVCQDCLPVRIQDHNKSTLLKLDNVPSSPPSFLFSDRSARLWVLMGMILLKRRENMCRVQSVVFRNHSHVQLLLHDTIHFIVIRRESLSCSEFQLLLQCQRWAQTGEQIYNRCRTNKHTSANVK